MENITFNFYHKFDKHFAGSHKNYSLYVGLILLFIIINIFSCQFKIIVDIETLYWVFSSLLQALLALVALMGVVSIFKLQNLQSNESRILDEVNNPMNGYFSLLNNRYSTIESLHSAIGEFLSKSKREETHIIVVMQYRIDDLLSSKMLVTDYAVKYTIFTFTIALVALLFLMLVSQISFLYLGVNSLYLMFILTSYSLFFAAKGFIYSIKG